MLTLTHYYINKGQNQSRLFVRERVGLLTEHSRRWELTLASLPLCWHTFSVYWNPSKKFACKVWNNGTWTTTIFFNAGYSITVKLCPKYNHCMEHLTVLSILHLLQHLMISKNVIFLDWGSCNTLAMYITEKKNEGNVNDPCDMKHMG